MARLLLSLSLCIACSTLNASGGVAHPKDQLTVADLADACRAKSPICSTTLDMFLHGLFFGAMSWGEYKRLSDIAYDLGENRCMKLVHRKQYDRLAEEFVGYVEQNATDADPKDPAMMTVLGFATRHGREQ